MSATYRVLKYDDNDEDGNVWLQVSDAWTPEMSWIEAEELGGAFGAGAFLLVPGTGEFGRVQEHVIVTRQTYEFQVTEEEVST